MDNRLSSNVDIQAPQDDSIICHPEMQKISDLHRVPGLTLFQTSNA